MDGVILAEFSKTPIAWAPPRVVIDGLVRRFARVLVRSVVPQVAGMAADPQDVYIEGEGRFFQ